MTGRVRRSHPLYVIPHEYASDPEVRKVLWSEDCYMLAGSLENGDLAVYATDLPGSTYFTISTYYGDEEACLEDFLQPYTPTPEEVVRALRGPQGETGPMGPKGDRGEDLSEGGGRAKGSER